MKVIFVIPFSPVYQNLNSSTSSQDYIEAPYSLNSKGEPVYFLRKDWGGIIGEFITAADNNIQWEVWRPDYRADRVMEHTFSDGMVFKSFPTQKRIWLNGIIPQRMHYSRELESELIVKCKKTDDLLVLLATKEELSYLLHKELKKYNKHMLYYNFINVNLFFPEFVYTYNPIKLLHRFFLYIQSCKRVSLIENLQVFSEDIADKIKLKYPNKKVFVAQIGIDSNEWSNNTSKESARLALGLPYNAFVFLLSQRLVPEYQIDIWLGVLNELRDKDFICIITGTGEKHDVDFLFDLCDKYQLRDKVKFVGYISDYELRMYYAACDVFVSLPVLSGRSTSVIQAMMMGKPIIQTNNGDTYNILKKYNAGLILDSLDRSKWHLTISKIITHQNIKLVPQSEIYRLINWEHCSSEWIRAIKQVAYGEDLS